MKTPMDIYNTAMKKKKNRKGFSLVELIVVLVIMAILAAALVPSLIGYIRQTKYSNVQNEAASCVSAAQTIASSAYADPNNSYSYETNAGSSLQFNVDMTSGTAVTAGDLVTAIQDMAEVDGTVTSVTIKNGQVTDLSYTNKDSSIDAVYDKDSTTKVYEIKKHS